MRKRMAGVLLAAVSACSVLTPAASAYTPHYDDMETEQNGNFYAQKYEANFPDDAVFTFSHPDYNENTGGFSCKWDGVFAAMAEVGWSLPESYAGKSCKAFPGLRVTYDADFYTDSNSYFGIHGCTKNPLTEYYIIEGWGSWRPPGGEGRTCTVNTDGVLYDLYHTMRYNAPSVDGPRTYPMYYCVRQSNSVTMGVQNRVAATVDVYGIFQQMENAGLDVSGRLESCGLFAECYGGGRYDASGSFTVHSASRSWNDGSASDWFLTDDPSKPVTTAPVTTAPVQTEPAVTTTTEPKLPADENGVFFREDFESGRGDWEKRAYKDDTSVLAADTAYYAEGQQSLYVTERSDSWNGAALSLEPYAIEPGKAYSFQAAVMQNSTAETAIRMNLESIDGSWAAKHYDLIGKADCRKGEWTVIRTEDFVIPAGSTDLKLYFDMDCPSGADWETYDTAALNCDFRIDSVTVAEAGKAVPIDLFGARPAPVSGQTGDANCDGAVDVSDAVLVMRYAVADREAVISEQGLKNADTDKNGNTDSDDATLILQNIAKKIRL